LSKGLLIALEQNEFRLLKIVADAVREMSEGELLQIEKARRLDVQEDVYFEIIRKKTASLIASCCACGAASVNASEEDIRTLWKFGEYAGTAFQIKDDLFDYDRKSDTGKPHGTDIRDQKMTLPLIYLLNQASWAEKRWAINTVKNRSNDPVRVAELIARVSDCGGLDYARDKMVDYRDKSLVILKQFPDNAFRKSLEELVLFTIERTK
jgi:octaprenyl-diphosphate synthase